MLFSIKKSKLILYKFLNFQLFPFPHAHTVLELKFRHLVTEMQYKTYESNFAEQIEKPWAGEAIAWYLEAWKAGYRQIYNMHV
jgi:hypothetical protein